MTLKDLLINLIIEAKRYTDEFIEKTKLLRLAYLVEYFFYRKTQTRLLNIDWIYYLYGPWIPSYDSILEKYPFKVSKKKLEGNKTISIIEVESGYDLYDKGNTVTKNTIIKVSRRFLLMDLKNILDYIYFDTEPMIQAETRKEILSFEKVEPETNYKSKNLVVDCKKIAKIRKKFANRKKHLNS
jgi:hypothetical protein